MSVRLITPELLAIASSPPISADWGIAVSVMIIGLTSVWRWAQTKERDGDSLHHARLLDYQSRERIALEREAAAQQNLLITTKALNDLSEIYRSLLHELRQLRSQQIIVDKKTHERLGQVQREGAIVMTDARLRYRELSDRILLLTTAIEAQPPHPLVPQPSRRNGVAVSSESVNDGRKDAGRTRTPE